MGIDRFRVNAISECPERNRRTGSGRTERGSTGLGRLVSKGLDSGQKIPIIRSRGTQGLQSRRKAKQAELPADFIYQLTEEDYENLRSQIVISRQVSGRSQIATGFHGGPRYLPYAFIEPGILMAANVLYREHAIQMSVSLVRAFVRMRQMVIEQQDLARKLAELEKELTARLDVHETAISEMHRLQDLPMLISFSG